MKTEGNEGKFKWCYALGMTIGGSRHSVYKDYDKKVQKEVHGKKVTYYIDNDDREFLTEDALIHALNQTKEG